jgi:hypothetical protein
MFVISVKRYNRETTFEPNQTKTIKSFQIPPGSVLFRFIVFFIIIDEPNVPGTKL